MEGAILEAEGRVEELQAQVGDPAVMGDRNRMHEACEKLGEAQKEVERLYARWGALEGKQ
jgi:hypothetical protein